VVPGAAWILTALGAAAISSAAAAEALQNVSGRAGTTLNGEWRVIVDPYENGYYNYRREPFDVAPEPSGGYFLDRKPADRSELVEYDFDASPKLAVPSDWNSQDERLYYYEGSVWYRRKFDYTPTAGRRMFVHFGAANYQADVYLNGRKLGRHVGGFTPFQFEITGMLAARGNSLVVKVDNTRRAEGIPTVNTDWWNYGGLTRDVTIVETPATYIRDYVVQLATASSDRVAASVELDGAKAAGVGVTLSIPEAGIRVRALSDARGVATFDVAARAIETWSPRNARLYEVELATDDDRIRERIGFRSIAVTGAEILLNGEPVFLRGISLHEENPLRGGRAHSEQDARLLLGWAKELGCNFVRLAHYPHNEHMARVADELGLMVWAEVPVYWTIQWENPETLANAKQQLRELIQRDRNRASVIVWSVANETPVSEPRTRFLRTLVESARALDSTRLVAAALEVRRDPADANHRIVDDPFGAYIDLLSFNEYVGWYDGLPDKLPRIRWTFGYDKPVVISEFGADALHGRHGDRLARFSEEYQEDLYRQTLLMLQRLPQWRGTTPWILADFRSPRRPLPGVQDGWNRKGLISDKGAKKKAFYVLQDFYTKIARREAAATAHETIDAGRTLALMEKVADWQLAHLEPVASIKVMREETRSPRSWQQGAFYAGLTALAQRSKSTRFRDAVLAHGRGTDWQLGDRRYHADDHVIGQSYLWAAAHGAGQDAIAPLRKRLDEILADPPRGSLAAHASEQCWDRWCWCDALFMAPPVWIELAAVTGDLRYAQYAHTEFKATRDYLYDREEHLFYRDSRFFEQRDNSGRKLFWSRGNGWVFAGVARVLERLPASDPARPMYEELFKEMAAKLKAVQKPDGYWAPSLLAAPEATPPESSGTGFFVYGMAWGIAAGLLDRAEYEPVVRRGWRALERAVHPDGMLGWVQQVSDRPEHVAPSDTQFYGVGAFLLAGSAVHDLYRSTPAPSR
jgi:beta-glucuronidase